MVWSKVLNTRLSVLIIEQKKKVVKKLDKCSYCGKEQKWFLIFEKIHTLLDGCCENHFFEVVSFNIKKGYELINIGENN